MAAPQRSVFRPWSIKYSLLLWPAVGLWCLAGCGGGPHRYQYTGKVSFEGQPVPFGDVVFQPDVQAGNTGPSGYAKIVNGSYTTASDRGAVGGPHIVRISGFANAPANENEVAKPLFSDFEIRVDLPKQSGTKDFEVSAAAVKAAVGKPAFRGGEP